MLARLIDTINERLRINAIRRLIEYVEVPRSEIVWLLLLALAFAIFEGVGISLLLPILQFAEDGAAAFEQASGRIWAFLAQIIEVLNLPLTLPVLLALAFIPILIRQVIFFVNAWYSAYVAAGIGIRMRLQTLDAVLDADPEFYERYALGDIVGVVVTQSTNAGTAILMVVRQLSIVFLMAVYIAILFAISAPLTLVTVAFALLVALAIKASITRIRESGVEFADVSQAMMGKIVERFSMIRLIKLRDQKKHERERIEGYSETMRRIQVKQGRLGGLVEVTADPLLMLSVFSTLYIGIAVFGMSLAQLGLLMFVLTRLNAKVKEFNQGLQIISQYMGSVLLVRQMTDDAAASNTIHRGEVPFRGVSEAIALRGVSFEYPGARNAEPGHGEPTPVLHDVTLDVPAGSFTAIVGRSGSGKSTLVELLPRLRDVTAGEILMDGVDVRSFDVGQLRRGIGYLTQNAMLFNDTVMANLTYGLDHDVTDDQIRTAIEDAFATFVYDLPNGLETNIGDQGLRLSGGERQRIALARVLLENVSVLILDEPTSALDSESESYIQQALARIHGKKTVIVIAHRLATVIQADQLLVMDKGRIVERGTHDELMAKGDAYQRLFESQLLKTDA